MLQPFELVVSQISRTDQQLMYYLILEQKETNRLLKELLGDKESEQADKIDTMKRQDLMKVFSKLENKPAGWNRWDTEDIRKHLKEVS